MTNQQAEAQFGGEKHFVQTGGVGTVVANESDLDKALAELQRQAQTKVDLIVPAQSLRAEPFLEDQPIPGSEGGTERHYGIHIAVPIPNFPPILMSVNPFAHTQLATALGIGSYYYNRLLEGDEDTMALLAENVNHWLRRRDGNFLVRTLDNHIRAFLSDKYAIRDSLDLLLASMEPIIESGAKVTQVTMTDRRFHLRALHSEWKERVARQQRDDVDLLFAGDLHAGNHAHAGSLPRARRGGDVGGGVVVAHRHRVQAGRARRGRQATGVHVQIPAGGQARMHVQIKRVHLQRVLSRVHQVHARSRSRRTPSAAS